MVVGLQGGPEINPQSIMITTKHWCGQGAGGESGVIYDGTTIHYHMRPWHAAIEANTSTIMPGYANGEASGDSGVLAKLALRWQALPEVALSAFADYGRLKLSRDPLPATTKNDKRMTDSGVSIDWLIGKGVSANAIIAWAGQEAPNVADNARPRMWFSLGYGW
jgi:hypothetical protein